MNHEPLTMNHEPLTMNLSKPLTLPQADPEMDDWELRSYNIPDLSTESVPFDEKDVKMLFEKVSATPFH
jgi:hypothetical protein